MKSIFAIVLMTLPIIANAFTGKVEINGIYYNLTTKANVAEVTTGDSPYSEGMINIPSSVEYDGTICYVTSIGDKAFKDCINLKSISIPQGVITIGSSAFMNCKSLENIQIPESVTTINGSAFWYCSGLRSVTFPASLTYMRDAFNQNTSLESVYITDLASWCKLNFYMLRSNPLSYAKHLYVNGEELTDLVIPEGLTTIGDSFWGFNALKSLVIPEGITEIGPCAFGNCENLTSVSIANTVNKIDYYAFRGCNALKEIRIPNSVTYIGEQDFKDCTELKTVIIGDGLDYLGSSSFSGCTELTDVYIYAQKRPKTYYDDAFSNSDIKYAKLHVRESLIDSFKSDIPWKKFGSIVKIPEIMYWVDGEYYDKDVVMIGAPVIAIDDPVKEGHTFSGWSEMPDLMPERDVDVYGTFTVNYYKVDFVSEGLVVKEETLAYGSAITVPDNPTKIGYSFEGWYPLVGQAVPAYDVTYTAQFSINQYCITFDTDGGSAIPPITQDYGTKITNPANPTKEGYSFIGWDVDIPQTMPAENITIKAKWSINSYILTYKVENEVYKEYSLNYNTTILPEAEPTKEGYTFSGWSNTPATMPAQDFEVFGSFNANLYKVSYFVENNLVHEEEVAFGEEFELWTYIPDNNEYIFNGWIGETYETMPSHDISFMADITSGIDYIYNNTENIEYVYSLDGMKVEKTHKSVYVVGTKNGNSQKVLIAK